MKKTFILVFIFISISTSAQLTHSISLGPDLGIGANFGKAAKLSLGGDIDYVLKFPSSIGIRLAAGYNKFNDNIPGLFVSFFRARGGIQGFLYKNIFFVYGEGGIASYKSSNPDPTLTRFSWAAGAGFNKYLGEGKQAIQTSAFFNFFKHSSFLNYTWFNIRVAYSFSWGGPRKAKEP